jgi:hypothetical protein
VRDAQAVAAVVAPAAERAVAAAAKGRMLRRGSNDKGCRSGPTVDAPDFLCSPPRTPALDAAGRCARARAGEVVDAAVAECQE